MLAVGSPQSTLCAFGGLNASSRESSNGPSRLSSPPSTPLEPYKDDAWDLLYAAAGQVMSIRLNEEPDLQHRQQHAGLRAEREDKAGLRAARNPRRRESRDPILFCRSSSDSDAESDSGADGAAAVHAILEPSSKDQLIGLLCDAALGDPALHARIRDVADRDVSHRKVFVHGLS